MTRSTICASLAAALAVGAGQAMAQYSAHGDFGGYTYRSPYRNSSHSLRFDTRETYLRNGRLSSHANPTGAAGLLPTGPTIPLANARGSSSPALPWVTHAPTLGASPVGITSAPGLPQPTAGLSSGPSLSRGPTLAWDSGRPSTPQSQAGAQAKGAPSAARPPAKGTYSPYSDQNWTAKRKLYRTNR